MYINKLIIKNIRSISNFEMTFDQPAGWHVIIGDNGAGKSSILRAISLGIIGLYGVGALRIDLDNWLGRDSKELGSVFLEVAKHDEDLKGEKRADITSFDVKLTIDWTGDDGYELRCAEGFEIGRKNIWTDVKYGWFACAFGPFRRFTGNEKKWTGLYTQDPRIASHLSLFNENVALHEAVFWLHVLYLDSLNQSSNTCNTSIFIFKSFKALLNETGLLPDGIKFDTITDEGIFFMDGNLKIELSEMSDGYRSILSVVFELIRHMVRIYGHNVVFAHFEKGNFTIDLPGVVLIDEVEVHLSPSLQVRIGEWFLRVFPKIQFIVTTHSPFICRAAENGSIWKLQTQDSEYPQCEVTGIEKDRLILGDLLDAYGTELFGRDITQSESGLRLSERLGQLNMKSFQAELTKEEEEELNRLRNITSTGV